MSNTFKSFIPLIVPPEFVEQLGTIEPTFGDKHLAVDPVGAQWRAVGLVPASEDELIHKLDGAGYLLNVQFNERMLPGAVCQEHLDARVAEIAERQGYKVGKKQIAELKDEVVFDLLPKAFIKRTIVPVMFLPAGRVLVFTGSPKRCDDVMSLLNGVFSGWDTYTPRLLETIDNPVSALTYIASAEPGHDDLFAADCAATLKGENKRTIRVKDRDIYSDEITDLLTNGYEVHELAMTYHPDGFQDGDGEQTLSFTLTDKIVFKRVLFPDLYRDAQIKGEDGVIDAHSFAWLVAREYGHLAENLFKTMGGIRQPATTDDSEDEL